MSFEEQALVEANELTEQQYNDFLDKVEQEPSLRAPIDGPTTRLGFEFMEDVGTRIKETLHIRKKDIDFRTKIVTVVHPKTEKQCKCSRWKYKDLFSRKRVLIESDKNCKRCHGKGKWKKPQRTTFTSRIDQKLFHYCDTLQDEELLWPTTRQSFWNWGKSAGRKANINIFQQKDERLIEGVFLHLFRALCSKRMTRDAMDNMYKDDLISCKLRHSYNPKIMKDRYTKVDINYLIKWEREKYSLVNSVITR